jgi:sugar phosphate isomerase/epimerase
MKIYIKSITTTASVAVLMVLSSCAGSGPDLGIGLQLYSVRDAMGKDPVGTIEKVGAMGYDFVESAGYKDGRIYGMEPLEFKKVVEENGMVYLGAHSAQAVPDSGGWESLMPWWDVCIATHKAAGAEYIIQPKMYSSGYESLEGLAQYCEYFNAVGEKCNAAGIRFGYHNHAHEFKELEGEVIYKYLLENTDPEKVMFQMDIYWIIEGGGSPAEYIEKYAGRFGSFHIKDEKELGESGEIDFIPILKLAEKAGVKYHVVEVVKYNFEPIVSVDKSLEYLKEIGYVK